MAQIAKDIGAKANPRTLAKAAANYENSAVRRLGYLLEQAGHTRQAKALEPFVKKANTAVSLDPSVNPLIQRRRRHASLRARLEGIDSLHQG